MNDRHNKLNTRFIRPDMDPQKLQHFLAVYRHGNFHKAADEGTVTQQAVSKAIARLEDQLGLQLFERTPLGVNPTPYAHALARHAKIILSEINLATSELMSMRGSTAGFVQIGLGWSFIPRIGPEAIQQFRGQRPGVGLRIVSGNSEHLFPRLLQGELDFVVSAPPKEDVIDKGLAMQALFVEQDSVFMRQQHPLALKKSTSFADLNQYPWLMNMSNPKRWHSICEAFVREGLSPPKEVLDIDSVSVAKSMLLGGDYITLGVEGIMVLEIEHGLCYSFKPSALHLTRTAVLATRKGSELQPAARLLKSIFLNTCQKLYF